MDVSMSFRLRSVLSLGMLTVAAFASVASSSAKKNFEEDFNTLLCERDMECADLEGDGVLVYECDAWFAFDTECKFSRKAMDPCLDQLLVAPCNDARGEVIVPLECDDVYSCD
jgi:hypothetical protein